MFGSVRGDRKVKPGARCVRHPHGHPFGSIPGRRGVPEVPRCEPAGNPATRRNNQPEGEGSREKEEAANALAHFVATAAARQDKAGGLFSIENPDSSYVWLFGPVSALKERHREVVFDQFMYGLCFQDDVCGKWTVRKRTRLVTNSAGLAKLASICDDKVRLNGHSYDLARLAGAYPATLCAAWSQALRDELGSWRGARQA